MDVGAGPEAGDRPQARRAPPGRGLRRVSEAGLVGKGRGPGRSRPETFHPTLIRQEDVCYSPISRGWLVMTKVFSDIRKINTPPTFLSELSPFGRKGAVNDFNTLRLKEFSHGDKVLI